MSVRHPCPACRKEMLLDVVHEGFEVPCPHCGTRFPVPAGAASRVPATLAATTGTGDAAADVPPPRRPPSEADGSIALVLGILGMFGVALSPCSNFCSLPLGILSPAAWYFGHRGRAAARAEGREPPGAVTAGWVLGVVGTGLLVVGGCVIAAVVTFAISQAP